MLINEENFNSTAGLNTTKWGPGGWFFLFSCIMGGYPVKIDNTNSEHILVQKHFKIMFQSLGYIMPCVFCRESFKKFYKELPIDDFLVGRIQLMYWLYLIRNKVNTKLIKQELECYTNEKTRLLELYKNKRISKNNYTTLLSTFKRQTLVTNKSPSFLQVLKKYESIRAVCSTKAQKCT